MRDCNLVVSDQPGQRDQDLQLIFESANASAQKEDAYNTRLALNRPEWMGVLANLILARYVVPDKVPLALAVSRFFDEDVRAGVPVECYQDSNSFRADFCYIVSPPRPASITSVC